MVITEIETKLEGTKDEIIAIVNSLKEIQIEKDNQNKQNVQ